MPARARAAGPFWTPPSIASPTRFLCRTADAGLFGYEYAPDGAVIVVGDVDAMAGGSVPANCFRYGGALGACASDGEQFDGKDTCTQCCAGLVPVIKAVADDGGGDAGPGDCPLAGTCGKYAYVTEPGQARAP